MEKDLKKQELPWDYQCRFCVHFDKENPHKLRCDAFPDGIPLEIAHNVVDHRFAFPGDNGIRYVSVPGKRKSPFIEDEEMNEVRQLGLDH